MLGVLRGARRLIGRQSSYFLEARSVGSREALLEAGAY